MSPSIYRPLVALSFATTLCAFVSAMLVPPSTSSSVSPMPAWLAAEAQWGRQNDVSPVFTPDGNTVFFSRMQGATGLTRRIYVAHRQGDVWTTPQLAPFSDQWMDLEPAMAPDGSYVIFISNRPATDGGKALDGYYGGKPQPSAGGNLWRVDLHHGRWGAAVRLPDIVNTSTSTYAPAIAADGSVYFMKPDPATGHFRLYLSRFVRGHFLVPEALSFSDGHISDFDPTVAPDKSFIVFSSSRKPSPPNTAGLFVSFATPKGWSEPVPLGPGGFEARLDQNQSVLYFSAADKSIRSFPIGEWLAKHRHAG